ncbi:LppA family lipoprotein [Actinokineospora sp.]|uniref:LppA family lipoprotein n=1 Tax=Actinokineospora sp. TaxID=1872133 RepID=UPI0040380284
MFGKSARKSAVFAARLVAVLALTACGSSNGRTPVTTMETTSADSADQYREMQTRPDIEEITRRYEELTSTIRRRTVTDLGLPPWITNDKLSRSGCRAYPGVSQNDKEARGLPIWYVEANIADEKWPDAVRIVTEIANGYGFGDVTTVVDGPGRHEISITDRYGGELIFGTRINTALSVRTGCHLRPASGETPTTS